MDMFVAYVLPLNLTTVSQARNQGGWSGQTTPVR